MLQGLLLGSTVCANAELKLGYVSKAISWIVARGSHATESRLDLVSDGPGCWPGMLKFSPSPSLAASAAALRPAEPSFPCFGPNSS